MTSFTVGQSKYIIVDVNGKFHYKNCNFQLQKWRVKISWFFVFLDETTIEYISKPYDGMSQPKPQSRDALRVQQTKICLKKKTEWIIIKLMRNKNEKIRNLN